MRRLGCAARAKRKGADTRLSAFCRAMQLQKLPLHHRNSAAANGDLFDLGVDLYAAGATHVVALTDNKLLWR